MALLSILAEIYPLTAAPSLPPPPTLPDPHPAALEALFRSRGRAQLRYQGRLSPDVLLATGAAWADEVLQPKSTPRSGQTAEPERQAWLEILQHGAALPAAAEVGLQIALRHPVSWLEDGLVALLGDRLIVPLQRRLARQAEHRALRLLLGLAPHLAVQTLGFDARGERTAAYGPHTLRLRLEASGTVAIFQGDRRLRQLSTVRRGADIEDLYAQRDGLDRLIHLAGALPQAFATEWLEEQILLQRSWPWSVWRALLVENPLLQPLAHGQVFQAGVGGPIWMLTEEGELIDADLGVIGPSPEQPLHLPHPSSLDMGVCAVWRSLQREARPVPVLHHLEREAVVLETAGGLPILPTGLLLAGVLVGQLRQRGWQPDAPLWHQGRQRCLGIHREFSGGWSVRLQHTGHYPAQDRLNERDQIQLLGISAEREGEGVHWTAVPPLIWAEVQADMQLPAGVLRAGSGRAGADGGVRRRKSVRAAHGDG